MMRKARLPLLAVMVTGAVMLPAGSGSADSNAFGTCPDSYTPTPFLAGPDEDRNGNGVVCIKPTNGQTHDDPNGRRYRCNGFPVPPAECTTNPDAEFFVGDDIV